MQPAVGVDGLGGRLRHVVIALHHVVAAAAHLALDAAGTGISGLRVDHLDLDARHGPADGCGLPADVVADEGLGDDG